MFKTVILCFLFLFFSTFALAGIDCAEAIKKSAAKSFGNNNIVVTKEDFRLKPGESRMLGMYDVFHSSEANFIADVYIAETGYMGGKIVRGYIVNPENCSIANIMDVIIDI